MKVYLATTIDQANEVLSHFLIDWNQRFAVTPKEEKNLFRKSPSLTQLDQILCLKQTRTVQNDHTVSFEGLILQIPPSKKFPYLAKRKVQVLQLKQGDIVIKINGHCLVSFPLQTVTRLAKQSFYRA